MSRYIPNMPQEIPMPECKKPPMGIMPRWLWDEKRQEELTAAMCRFFEVGRPVPAEWVDEYNELSEKLSARMRIVK